MKRILGCLLCLLLAVSAAACGGASSGESSGGISPPPAASAGAESAGAADVSDASDTSKESDDFGRAFGARRFRRGAKIHALRALRRDGGAHGTEGDLVFRNLRQRTRRGDRGRRRRARRHYVDAADGRRRIRLYRGQGRRRLRLRYAQPLLYARFDCRAGAGADGGRQHPLRRRGPGGHRRENL